MWPFFLIFILTFSLSFKIQADEKKEQIPEILIEASLDSNEEIHSQATVIKAQHYQNQMLDVSEVLSRLAGVHIQRFGGLADSTSVSIRGSASNEIAFLLDDIPLNLSSGTTVDLSPYFLESLDSIEIFRGLSPIDSGLTGASGLIHLKSQNFKKGNHAAFNLSYGSFNTLKTGGYFSHQKNNFGFLGSINYLRTSGDFSFWDDNATPLNVADDSKVKRQNNQSQTIYPYIKLIYDFDKNTQLKWSNHFISKDNGVPGLGSNQSLTAHLNRTEYLSNFKITRDNFFHKNLGFESKTYFRFLKTQFSDLNGEIGLGGIQDNDDDTFVFGQQLTFKFFPNFHHTLKNVLLYQTEVFNPEDFTKTPSKGSTSKRTQLNFGFSDDMDFFDHKLKLAPQFVFQNIFNSYNNDDPSFLAPGNFQNTSTQHTYSLSLGAQTKITSNLTFLTHGGRSVRLPTFEELFGDQGGIVGNVFLNPQENIYWDAGFLYHIHQFKKLDSLKIRLSYFDRFVGNLIQFQQNGNFAQAQNIGEAHIYGIEFESLATFLNYFALTFNYTWQQAIDKANNPGNFLVGRPQHESFANFDAHFKKWKFFTNINWMDESFLDALNTRVVQDKLILNSGASYQFHKNWTFGFEVKNITNDQIIDVVGYPLPGRSFFGKVSWRYEE